jgi:hypothetical protein
MHPKVQSLTQEQLDAYMQCWDRVTALASYHAVAVTNVPASHPHSEALIDAGLLFVAPREHGMPEDLVYLTEFNHIFLYYRPVVRVSKKGNMLRDRPHPTKTRTVA